MFLNTKEVEIGGKTYTLTVKRSMVATLARIAPETIKINTVKNLTEDEKNDLAYNAGVKIYENVDALFYEMIRVQHPELTRLESNKIYAQFCDEYNDVDENIIKFFQSSFTDGIPRENKKNLNWEN